MLTKMPMYAVIGGGLSVLISIAFLGSLFSALSFHPLALIASTLVFCGVSIGASALFGKIYGIYSHLRSALITALILSLIFTPSFEVFTLMQYALIAVVAQASKFVVAYKGRHIFNPAAFGALLGGLLSLSYASWWVANPVLIIPTILGAFLVLYKTRQLQIGGLFLGISILLITIAALLRGDTFIVAITAIATSWPIFFFAGFMLSEPLTLPPRKKQKVIIAAVAAVLISLPFGIGDFNSSPEFALLAANLVAFILAFRQRQGITLTFRKRRTLTPTVQEFIFETDHAVSFEPGQYIEITVPHKKEDGRGTRRSFSVTSTPGENELRMAMKFYDPSSTLKKQLKAIAPGTKIQTTGITGDFVLPKDAGQKLLFVAGGIGITPFISQIAASKVEGRDITVLYFAKNADELAYRTQLDKSGAIVHYFTADADKDMNHGSRLNEKTVKKYVTGQGFDAAYISGPPAMVASAKHLLKNDIRHIKTDYFSGY